MNTCPRCKSADVEHEDPENLHFRCMQCGTTFYGQETQFIEATL